MPVPRVSVVISNFNYARFLREAIESALNQDYAATEVVVVDDGSTDDSVRVINAFGDRIVKVLKPNGGHGSCINAGFAACHGDIVLFMDADDRYHPDTVSTVVDAFRSGAVLVHFRANLIDENGRFLAEYPWKRVTLDSGDVVPILTSRGTFTCMVSTANAFRRTVLESLLPLDEAMFARAPDGYLVHAAPFYGSVSAIAKPLADYRIHGSNDSTTHWSRSSVDVAKLRGILAFSTRELEVVRANAVRRGLPVADGLPLKHMRHVQFRLVSLVLDPSGHPFQGDTVRRLSMAGAAAALRNAALPLERRCAMACWFLGVGVLPQLAARWLVARAVAPPRNRRVWRAIMRRLRFSH